MRKMARRMFDAAVAAADPALALRPHLTGMAADNVTIIAVGKAAISMATEAKRHFPDAKCLIVTNAENAREVAGCQTFVAGHPVPDEGGLRAGVAVIKTLRGATANDTIIALISGGGSALLPAPVDGISLDDKAEVSRQLLAAGFDITEMNMVRQQLSQLKGGGLLRFAAPANVKAFILSDVIGDDLRVIASGPTVAPIGTRDDARALLQSREIWDSLPVSVRNHLSHNGDVDLLPAAKNTLIGSNRQSLEAVQSVAPSAVIVNDHLTGDVADAARTIVNAAKTHTEHILIFGGETTVALTGSGKGGRNQELALRVAIEAEATGLTGWTFLSGGTDGRDGPTDSAGGIVDDGTLTRIRQTADPLALLANNDSNHALSLADDLLITGGTGTNVADVQIFLPFKTATLIDEILEIDALTLKNHRIEGSSDLDLIEHRVSVSALLQKSETVAVRRQQVLVAYAHLRPLEEKMWFVGGIAVHPAYKNVGVIRELVTDLVMLLDTHKINMLRSNVFKANTASVRLHERLGFKVTRENDFGLEYTLSNLDNLK